MEGLAFGLELRRQRERVGVTLEAIAAETKIGKALLAGLERGDCKRWPGTIYSRAYIRDYARAIGLDPDETAARFAAVFEPPPPEPPAPAPGRGAGLRLLAADWLTALANWLDATNRRSPRNRHSTSA